MEIVSNNKKNVTNGGTVPIIDIFFRTLHYWPWLLLSLVFCITCGLFYVLRTPSIYTQSASLLVKEDGKGKSTGGVDQFGEFGLFSQNTNIQNEIMTLKSPDLMEEVVKRLNLDMNYYLPGRFHKVVAYGSTLPAKVSFPNADAQAGAAFNLEIAPGGKVNITDFRMGENKFPDIQGNLKDTLQSPLGAMVVEPGAAYNAEKTIEMSVNRIPLGAAIGSYEGRLGVALDNNQGTVINLTFSDQDIQRANEVLNTVIGVYNETWIRDKNQIAVSTSNFINERLAVIEDELGHVDSDISSYKSENLVPDVNTAASSYFAESQALGQEITALNNQMQMTRYVRNYLTSDGIHDKPLPTNTGMSNLDIEGQISEYNTKLLERNNLAAKSSDKNPLVQTLDKELDEMRGAIIGSVDNSITSLQTQMRGLQGARGAATSRLASSPTQAKYLLSVERQQKVKENLYLFLLQKREDNELSQAFTAYNTRVIKKPSASGIPPFPNKKNILVSCGLIGLLFPFGLIYVRSLLNTKVRGRKDVENLSLPMLGEIPQNGKLVKPSRRTNKKRRRKKNPTPHEILVKNGSRDIINEAFRVLRTNTEFTRVNKDGCNVIALTSFNPGSGKSFITMNLAASLALKNKKVLVIDGDMRHASASAYIEGEKTGLSDYLAGIVPTIDQIIVSVPEYEGLYLLPVGNIPPNPTELLEDSRFLPMVNMLRAEFDYIIIDCPPIEVVADAQIIDQAADRTVFIIRAGILERSMLGELEKIYNEKKFSQPAFILNGTLNDQGRYGYSHSYKYGYGYGYGYGYSYS